MPRLEIVCTYRCNAVCEYCNRAIGLANFKDADITAAQVRTAVDQVIRDKEKITRCTISGGEPLLNKELQSIIMEADRLPGLRHGRVLTNDLIQAREHIQLPKRWKWVPAPLRDPENPRSGKDDHVPFFISPADYGQEALWENCTVRGYCGKGLDAYGWSMCGVAATVGRIIGVDPYWQDGLNPHRKQEDICKHCVYGIGGETTRSRRRNQANFIKKAGTPISEVYKEGLKRHRSTPMVFTKMEPEDG